MSQPREIQLDVGWGKLAGLAWDNPGAPRALCLHGWMDNSASFIPLAPLLERLVVILQELQRRQEKGSLSSSSSARIKST